LIIIFSRPQSIANMALVVFEGRDGSGKSTLVAQLSRRLGDVAIATSDPRGTAHGRHLMTLLGQRDELELFVEARRELMNSVIGPALTRGELVLCDRYVDSTYAYQVAGSGYSRELVDAENASFPKADATFVLFCSDDVIQARLSSKGKDAIEKRGADYFKRVDDEYANRARQFGYVALDGAASVETNVERVVEHLRQTINGYFKNAERTHYSNVG
jgi:dTMP kinase